MATLQLSLLTAIIASNPGDYLLVFETPRCPHCQAMQVTVKRLRDAGLPVQSINVEQFPDLTQKHQIRRVPSFVMIRNGRETDRIVGRCSYSKLRQLMQTRRASDRNNPVRFQSPDPLPPEVSEDPEPLTVALPDNVDATGNSPQAVNASTAGPGKQPVDNNHSPTTRARQATVKIEVSDAGGSSFGSGTIIDSRAGEALIITCGHLFRESGTDSKILVTLYDQPKPQVIPATVLAFDADRIDVGFLVVHPRRPVYPVPVAQHGFRLAVQQPVFSVGCEEGALPKLRQSQVSALNRYLGPANIEVMGQPTDGVSGCGLFDQRGRLTGICRAADMDEQKGVFVGLPVIHEQLQMIGQSHLTRPPHTASAGSTSGLLQARLASARVGETGGDVSPDSGSRELFCIIRRPNQKTNDKLVVIRNPSQELLMLLEKESRHVSSIGPVGSAYPAPQAPKSARTGNISALPLTAETIEDPFQRQPLPE